MNIRRATLDDVPAIARQGMEFIGKLKMSTSVVVERVENSVAAIIGNHNGVVFIGETDEGEVAGFLIGMCVPLWFDALDWSAVELAWWMDPKHRGGGCAIRLVREFESWAAKLGVHRVVLSDVEFADLPHPAGTLIERLGYTLNERAFAKQT